MCAMCNWEVDFTHFCGVHWQTGDTLENNGKNELSKIWNLLEQGMQVSIASGFYKIRHAP